MYTPRPKAVPAPPQAWRNFNLELRSLRESFRFDDYANIAEANPPATPLGRAAYRVGQAVVDAFGALDRTLEDNKVCGFVRACVDCLLGKLQEWERGVTAERQSN